jgi:hypothetical protein
MHEYDVTLSVSYMEIYRDEVYDLFVERETVSHVLAIYQSSLPTTHPLPIGAQVTSQGE